MYDQWARDIAQGNWFGTGVFYQTPLYPYFLAGIYGLFGHSLTIVRLIQAVGGAAACVLVALAGRAFFSRKVGLIAGALLAGYAPALFFDGLIQKAALDLFFMALLLFLLGRLRSEARWPWLHPTTGARCSSSSRRRSTARKSCTT